MMAQKFPWNKSKSWELPLIFIPYISPIYHISNMYSYPIDFPHLSHIYIIFIQYLSHIFSIFIPYFFQYLSHIFSHMFPIFFPIFSHIFPIYFPYLSHIFPPYIIYPIYFPYFPINSIFSIDFPYIFHIFHRFSIDFPYISHIFDISHRFSVFFLQKMATFWRRGAPGAAGAAAQRDAAGHRDAQGSHGLHAGWGEDIHHRFMTWYTINIHPIGSMVLVYLPTKLGHLWGKCW